MPLLPPAQGINWTQPPAPKGVYSVAASSADGKVLVAVQNLDSSYGPGSVVTSSDNGATWGANATLKPATWSAAAISADGMRMVVASSADSSGDPVSGNIFVSTDGGATFGKQKDVGKCAIDSVTIDASGTSLYALGQFRGNATQGRRRLRSLNYQAIRSYF